MHVMDSGKKMVRIAVERLEYFTKRLQLKYSFSLYFN